MSVITKAIILPITILIFCLCLLVASGEENKIPLWYAPEKMLLLSVEVADSKSLFILDTGATHTVVNSDLAKKFGEVKVVGKSTVSTANGITTGIIIEIPELHIGDKKYYNVKMTVLEFPPGFPYGGLIGMDLMDKFDIREGYIISR